MNSTNNDDKTMSRAHVMSIIKEKIIHEQDKICNRLYTLMLKMTHLSIDPVSPRNVKKAAGAYISKWSYTYTTLCVFSTPTICNNIAENTAARNILLNDIIPLTNSSDEPYMGRYINIAYVDIFPPYMYA